MMTAFFSPIPSIFSYGAAAAAILGHVPSALYQWCVHSYHSESSV